MSQPTVYYSQLAEGSQCRRHNADLLGDHDQSLKQDEIIKGAEATVVLIIDNNPFIQITRQTTY